MKARAVMVEMALVALLGAWAPASTAQPSPAAADTPWVDAAPQAPTARYGSFRGARAALKSLVRHALGAWADSASWKLGRERYEYRDQPKLVKTTRGTYFWALEPRDTAAAVTALRMELATHVLGARGNEDIERALSAAGWTRDGIYDADGTDGTHFVMICREALCDVQASWDGGDDSDTTYVPVPGERIDLVCVPRPARDPRPRSGP